MFRGTQDFVDAVLHSEDRTGVVRFGSAAAAYRAALSKNGFFGEPSTRFSRNVRFICACANACRLQSTPTSSGSSPKPSSRAILLRILLPLLPQTLLAALEQSSTPSLLLFRRLQASLAPTQILRVAAKFTSATSRLPRPSQTWRGRSRMLPVSYRSALTSSPSLTATSPSLVSRRIVPSMQHWKSCTAFSYTVALLSLRGHKEAEAITRLRRGPSVSSFITSPCRPPSATSSSL